LWYLLIETWSTVLLEILLIVANRGECGALLLQVCVATGVSAALVGILRFVAQGGVFLVLLLFVRRVIVVLLDFLVCVATGITVVLLVLL
jgi:hypothetical protein